MIAAEHGFVVGAGPLGEDLDVVAVHVHRVLLVAGILDDESQRLVGAVVVHVPNLWEFPLSLVGTKQNGIVVVDAECAVGLVPDQMGAV